ncbi:MAG TPA: hypothetical protein VFR41_08475, partial [Acidimicrobiia bacterium]|nr:hypothetical protein [Acidimicrobiia bacterium]
MEHLAVALWGTPGADVRALLDTWVPEAHAAAGVVDGAIAFAEPDQGRFTGPVCNALIILGLDRAHDLDDLPARTVLYKAAREVEVWRVEPHQVVAHDDSNDLVMVSFLRRRADLSHEQFVRRWSMHAPLAVEHHG